jgi:hypothetical protein
VTNRDRLRSERPKPVLDAQHVEKLAEESSWAVAESFLAEYTALLPGALTGSAKR